MGLAELREIAVIHPVGFDELAGTTGAVDAFNWLYRYTSIAVRYTDPGVYTTRDGVEVPNLIGLLNGLPKFFEHRFFPIFVFDGRPVPLKRSALKARRKRRERAAMQAEEARARGDAREAARFRAQALRMTAPIRRSTDELLSLLDVPHFEAPAEAEAQAANMARGGAVDYAVTDDYDALLYGAPLTLREFTSEGPPECMDFRATLDEHAITWDQLVDVAILCGTDYNDGVQGVGPRRAIEAIIEHGDLDSVLTHLDATIDDADRIRDYFRHPRVTEAFDFERRCSPDLDATRSYLVDRWEIPEEAIASAFERLVEHRDAWQ